MSIDNSTSQQSTAITPEQIADFACKPENMEAFASVLEKVLPDYTRFIWGKPVAYKQFFTRWQKAGFTLYPNHYYSPIPDLTRLTSAQTSRRAGMAGIDLDTSAMLRLAESFHDRFVSEYAVFDKATRNSDAKFFFGNGVFERIDAEILHCMIRNYRPKRLIEIGSGFSSLVTAAACELNRAEGHPVEFSLIEPTLERRLFLEGQVVGADVLGLQGEHARQIEIPLRARLSRIGVDQVDVQVANTGGARRVEGAKAVVGRMHTPELDEHLVRLRLESVREPPHAEIE